MNVQVNLVAVLVAAISQMVIGMLWYGPIFGKKWMKLIGMTQNDLDNAKAKGMGKTYGISFVTSLVLSYVLAHFVTLVGAETMEQGLQTGFWAWLGFVATTSVTGYLWSPRPKPWLLYILDNGYQLISLVTMGAILTSLY